MTSARSGRATGALAMLAACFLASAVLRAGTVIAALPERDGPPAAEHPSVAAGAAGESPAALTELAAELRRQRAALAQREAAATEREQLLARRRGLGFREVHVVG